MDIRWYAVYDKATGALWDDCVTVDMDDPDTAIDEATGEPYSLSGMRGIAHPSVIAGTHEYRKDLSSPTQTKLAPRKTPLTERGPLESKRLAFDPRKAPDGDPEGRYEWDETKRDFVERSGAVIRERRLQAARAEEARIEADMTARGETVPSRAR